MQVLYADGDSESILLPVERVRLDINPGQPFAAPSAEELTASAHHLLCAADQADCAETKEGGQYRNYEVQLMVYDSISASAALQQTYLWAQAHCSMPVTMPCAWVSTCEGHCSYAEGKSRSEALRARAAELLQAADSAAVQAAQQGKHSQQQQPEPLAQGPSCQQRDLHSLQGPGDAPAAEDGAPAPVNSCTAAAEGFAIKADGAQQPQHDPSGRAGAQDLPALGEVVWAREKGWPHWPALVTTKETSRGLCNLRELLLPC